LNYLLKTILPELEARGVELRYRLGTSLFKLDEHQNLTKKKEWGFVSADDLVFLAASTQELHETLCICDRLMARSGMEMSVSKTKIMQTTTKDKSEALDLDLGTRGSVNEVSEFKYLGSIISADGSISTEITARIAKAGAVFAALRRNIFGARSLCREVKMKVYSASILSILLCGCETWNCTVADVRRLEAFHHRCLRCICGLSRLSDITNTNLKKLTGQKSIHCQRLREC